MSEFCVEPARGGGEELPAIGAGPVPTDSWERVHFPCLHHTDRCQITD